MMDLVYPQSPARLERGAVRGDASEMLPIVDINGVVLSQAPRSFCHGDGGGGLAHLHPTVHVHLIDRQARIYLQKRSETKKQFPGMWDTAVGGHVTYGEYVRETLYREAGEEIGLFDFSPVPLEPYLWESGTEKELVFPFAAVGSFALRPDGDEVSEGRWWTIPEIESSLGAGVFTANFEFEFARFAQSLLNLL